MNSEFGMRNSEFLRRLRAAFGSGRVINHLRDPWGRLGTNLGQVWDSQGEYATVYGSAWLNKGEIWGGYGGNMGRIWESGNFDITFK